MSSQSGWNDETSSEARGKCRKQRKDNSNCNKGEKNSGSNRLSHKLGYHAKGMFLNSMDRKVA